MHKYNKIHLHIKRLSKEEPSSTHLNINQYRQTKIAGIFN
jgi:hypothetical protein